MSYNDIPAGKDLPNDINVIIEIPANHDPIKYEVDKDSDAIFVDRFVATPMFIRQIMAMFPRHCLKMATRWMYWLYHPIQ